MQTPRASSAWLIAGGHPRAHWARTEKSSYDWLPTVLGATLRAIDCAVLLTAAFISYWLYVDMHLQADQAAEATDPFRQLYVALAIFALVLQLNVFQLAGLYRFSNLTNMIYQMGRSIAASAVLFLVLLGVLYLAKISETYSRGWMLLWFAMTAGGVSAARLIVCPMMERWVRRGNIAARVAIVGSGEPAGRLASYLGQFRDAPVRLCGIFHDSDSREEAHAARAAGTIEDLCQLARTQEIDQIILATPHISEDRLAGILRRMRSLPVDVRLSRDTLEYCLPQSSFEFCGIVPLLRLYNKPISGWGLLAKRVEDRLLAGLLLLAIAPVLLVVAALVKLDSRGPAIFKQQRYGFNNRVITVWKFRTMYVEQADSTGERQIAKDDPRVTRVGRVLRQWSLDELPQLINVLLGDMSIVGPRPHPLMCGVAGRLFEEVVEEYAARHRVKPGITGWAQVHGWHGAADTDEKIQERVKHDLYYIDNWSILLDLKILLMTIFIVLKRQDA